MDEHSVVQDMIGEGTGETVTVSTVRFGDIELAESRILTFPKGLVGLPNAKRFTFLHDEECPGLFFWMQSLDDPALAFVVCEPQQFFPSYIVSLSQSEQDELGIHSEEEGMVCVILVVPEDPAQITANLRGPVVLNVEERRGLQLILAGDDYPVDAPLFNGQEVEATEGGAACSS
ncbi:MAG: flagellar assembly protein FliW [Planctomycetota bacterium]